MTNPLGLPALISPYVGGKGGSRYFRKFGPHVQSLICDLPGYYDVIVEPFAGSGAATWQHNHGIPNAIAADIDPGVQAVWECWGEDDKKRLAVDEFIEEWKHHINAFPEAAFQNLKKAHAAPSDLLEQRAADYLIIKRLVFGGVLRCNNDGELNVALSADKLDKFLNSGKRHKQRCNFTYPLFPDKWDGGDFWGWQYRWPDNGIETLSFHPHWEDAVAALEVSEHERALVVLDPPYSSPRRKDRSRMTPAYTHGHENPHADDVLALCVDALDAVLATGKAARVVVFNYYSEELDEALFKVQEKHARFDSFVSKIGYLGGMNNAQAFHQRDIEACWEIGGRRMFRDFDAVEQLELCGVVE